MRRDIIEIDEDKCTGCGLCATACAEGAIEIIDGKARLVSETYCDGLGACLGECPEGALRIVQREADGFDAAAAAGHVAGGAPAGCPSSHCPGSAMRMLRRPAKAANAAPAAGDAASELGQWPVQLTLVPPNAPYFQGAELLLVADCVPFAMGDFHSRLLRGRAIAVGCPKLDAPAFYAEKLADILRASNLAGLTVVHMEVPCCMGLVRVAKAALERSGSTLPLREVTVGIDGRVIEES